MEPNEPNILQIASLIVERLKPELYEDMEYVCAISSALHCLPNDNPEFAHFADRIEQDAEFVKQVTIAAVEQIVRLPGIKTYFIGMMDIGGTGSDDYHENFDDGIPWDWDTPTRLPANEIVEIIRRRLNKLGREPNLVEVARFSGYEHINPT